MLEGQPGDAEHLPAQYNSCANNISTSTPMPTEISPPPLKRRKLSPSLPPEPDAPTAPPPDPAPRQSRAPSAPANPLRIFSWNINGVTPFLPANTPAITSFFRPSSPSSPPPSPPTPSLLRTFLAHHAYPALLLLQEVKISPHDPSTPRALLRAANPSPSPSSSASESSSGGPTYTLHLSLPRSRDPYTARGPSGTRRIYGVAALIRSDFHSTYVTRVSCPAWDTEGRVQLLLLDLPKLRLALLNVYSVNGTSTPWRDSRTGEVIGSRHDAKMAFHAKLRDECERWEGGGWEVVVAGDLNVARESRDGWPGLRRGPGGVHVRSRRDFEGKFFGRREKGEGKGLGMVDSYRWMHPTERKYSYRPRGVEWGGSADRVDYVMLSRGVVERRGLVEADILDTEADRGPSDHCPVFVALDVGLPEDETGEQMKGCEG